MRNLSKTGTKDIEQKILTIMSEGPKFLDLTNEEHSKSIIKAVDSLLELAPGIEQINRLEDQLISRYEESLIFILLVLKIVRSKIVINSIKEPLFISVIFAVYKEHNRIKKNSEHPHGEDFLLKKVDQLEWLLKDKSDSKWELIVVDDGCPEDSGKIAQAIIDRNQLNSKARVLFLKEAIEQNLPPAKSLSNTGDSQKGGSIVYGMWDAVEHKKVLNHIVMYTDADLSTHLGQIGLLLEPLVVQKQLAAIGSRRESRSVVIKKGSRNSRGKLFIYLWKRLIPNLGDIVDTQCGFKAFRAEIVPEIIHDLLEKKFAFDIELLLRTALIRKESIAKVPIAWIDSEEASTTTDIQPYLPMLNAIVNMYKKYVEANQKSNGFAVFIESLNEDDFNVILDHIPAAILKREPYEFTAYDAVTVSDIQNQ